MALASAAFWAFGSALVKNVTPRVSALYISVVRVGCGALLSVLITAMLGQIGLLGDTPLRVVGILLGCSLAVMLGNLGFVRAIALDDVSRVFPVTNGLYIMFSVVASVLFAGETLTWYIGVGGFLVLIGIYLLATGQRRQPVGPGGTPPRIRLLAMLIGGAAALSWSIGLIGVNDAMKYIEPMPANVIRMPFMAMMLTAMAAVRGDVRRYQVSRQDIVLMVLSGLLAGGSSITFVAALKWSEPATVAILNSTAPLFLAPLAFMFLHEHATWKVMAGTIICVAGVILTFL